MRQLYEELNNFNKKKRKLRLQYSWNLLSIEIIHRFQYRELFSTYGSDTSVNESLIYKSRHLLSTSWSKKY